MAAFKTLLCALLVLGWSCSSQPAPEPPPPGEPPADDTPITPPPPAGDAPGAGDCVPSGCSGTVCVEAGEEVVTTCEWKDEYACYRDAICTRQPDGLCGWTMTAELEQCLIQGGPEGD